MSGVVVGVDGTPGAMAALRWAAGQAELTGQPLTLVTVVEPAVVTTAGTGPPDDAARAAHLDAAREAVEQLLTGLEGERGRPLAVPVTLRARIGGPVDQLVHSAADADLLVVGSRSAGALSRLLLGSVSAGVAHQAHCSVVVVRDGPEGTADDAG